jgi:type 2 lantibiotic biosynthesis protein LanM
VRFATIQGWLRESPPITESSPRVSPPVAFGDLWVPIADGATAVLTSSLRFRPEQTVLDDVRTHLVARLAEVGEGIVWQHFNTRRTLSELIGAHLASDEHGLRRSIYCRILDELRVDGLGAINREYPILGEYLSATVDKWLTVTAELLTRVFEDRLSISETFGLPTDARLVGVRSDISDVHRGGRTVAILSFAVPADNGLRKLVYKPRDMRMDAAYHWLIGQLNASVTDLPPLKHLTVLCRANYGYEEYVPHQVCSNPAELQRFYYNAGRLIAIMHVLGCNDCHNENVIAHGDQLVLVDAETVLQGTPRRGIPDDGASAREILDARLAESVLRIGMLPQWFFVQGERHPRDVSALGTAAPETDTETRHGWQALNTDGMVAGEVVRPARLSGASPVSIGTPNRLVDFGYAVCAGFVAQLGRVVDDKQSWLRDDSGFLARFDDLRSRFVRRPTWTYQWMLDQLRSPVAMGGSAARERELSRLSKPDQPGPGGEDDAILAAERAQLLQLDVPYFEQCVSGTDLVIDDAIVAPGFFAYSGLASARRRIESLDADQAELQLALVRGLLAAKFRRAHRSQPRQSAHSIAAVEFPSSHVRREAAFAAGEVLLDSCVTDSNGTIEWLGIDSAPDLERSCYGPLGPSLYSGRAGIAVFLATLADMDPDRARAESYRAAATAALSDILRILKTPNAVADQQWWWRDQPLGLAGSGGQLLTALSLRRMLPEVQTALSHGLDGLVDALEPDQLAADDDTDIIFGCAGLIGPLLMIGTPRATELARAAGMRLVETQADDGGWIAPAIADRALTGFSHGASGRAAALARLAAVSGNEHCYEAAVQAVKYERSQFDSCERNWPDQRGAEGDGEPSFMLSWCHGAPGIALARLCMRATPLWDAAVEHDLATASTATTAPVPIDNSLCCGRMGRAAVLRMADRRGGTSRWRSATVDLEAAAIASMRTERGFDFGDVHGLFQGAAGLGLALLDGIPHAQTVLPKLLSAGLIE